MKVYGWSSKGFEKSTYIGRSALMVSGAAAMKTSLLISWPTIPSYSFVPFFLNPKLLSAGGTTEYEKLRDEAISSSMAKTSPEDETTAPALSFSRIVHGKYCK